MTHVTPSLFQYHRQYHCLQELQCRFWAWQSQTCHSTGLACFRCFRCCCCFHCAVDSPAFDSGGVLNSGDLWEKILILLHGDDWSTSYSSTSSDFITLHHASSRFSTTNANSWKKVKRTENGVPKWGQSHRTIQDGTRRYKTIQDDTRCQFSGALRSENWDSLKTPWRLPEIPWRPRTSRFNASCSCLCSGASGIKA